MKREWVVAAIVVTIVVGIAMGGLAMSGTPVNSGPMDMSKCSEEKTLGDLDEFQAGHYNGPLRDGLPYCLYKDLPDKPMDFDQVNTLVQFGQIKTEDFCTKLNDSYWKQPNFYPNNGAFYDMYRNPVRDADGTLRRGVYGYGSFISELTSTVSPGDSFSACVYLHTSWYIQTYQALGLKAVFPEYSEFKQDRFGDGQNYVRQENASQYFDVTITPSYLLLGRSYPWVDNNWADKVRMDIRVAPDTPKGKYMIVLTPGGQIPEAQNSEWFWKYKTDYVSASGFYQDILMLGVEVA